jgi:hypothetical protein
MAGKLRHLNPTMEPTGRIIRVRELVGGDPRQSRMVEVRLGCREDRADFHPGFCRARLHGRFDQCGKRPRKQAVVCGQHGGSYAVRERNGSRLPPAEAGRLSGLARRIKRDGRVDLDTIPTFIPWLRDRVAALKQQPELLYLQDDVANLTALRDLLVSAEIEMDLADRTRLLAVIAQVKGNLVRTMAIEGRTVVPIANVQRMAGIFIDLFKRYVPIENQAALLEDLRLSTRYDEPVPPYGANGP